MTVDTEIDMLIRRMPLTSSAIEGERMSAHLKHRSGPTGSMEMKAWTDPAWLPVVMEELGEASHELNEYLRSGRNTEGYTPEERRIRLVKELIQTAAMIHAWIEAVDNDRQ